MTIQTWVAAKLREDPGYDVEIEGGHGLVVHRELQPEARGYCPEASNTAPFTAKDLERAMEEMPGVRFVVAINRRVANKTYTLADKEGVAVGGLGALKSALVEAPNIGWYRSREQKFVQARLDGNAQVQSWRRRSESAYEVIRTGGRRSITIVTIRTYELTSEEVYRLIALHDGLKVDSIVSTNPNCLGFAQRTLDAAHHAGTQIMTLREFLAALRDS